jgi:hypothetical protein
VFVVLSNPLMCGLNRRKTCVDDDDNDYKMFRGALHWNME